MAPSQKTVADEAAEKAVREVFFLLGVDIDNIDSVNSFRDDLQFGRKLRLEAERGTKKFMNVVWGVVITGFLWGLQVKFGHLMGKP
jgi:hypothetical protein